MCFEVAYKTGKSLRQYDGMRETVPVRRTGNKNARSPILVRVRGTMRSSLQAERISFTAIYRRSSSLFDCQHSHSLLAVVLITFIGLCLSANYKHLSPWLFGSGYEPLSRTDKIDNVDQYLQCWVASGRRNGFSQVQGAVIVVDHKHQDLPSSTESGKWLAVSGAPPVPDGQGHVDVERKTKCDPCSGILHTL